MMPWRRWSPICAALLITGCTVVIPPSIEELGPTLADLEPALLPSERVAIEPPTLAEIEASYHDVLAVAEDPEIRQQVKIRLADIEMARSENRQISTAEQQLFFDEAIDMYDELLADSRSGEVEGIDDERVLYQMSKAYALDGRMAESAAALDRLVELNSASPYAAEANFRKAENAFSAGRYAEASELYHRVIAAGKTTPFYLNAVYMAGWSKFKNNQFEQSVATFTQVLDELLPIPKTLDQLSQTDLNLAEDTLRVMAIAFSYMEGPETITATYDAFGERHYQYLLYARLGDFYLDKERYRDAAATYQHFIDEFPGSDRGPEFAVQMIEVFKTAGFADEILPAKEAYVANYGFNSTFWAARDATARAPFLPTLGVFLDELSSYYHAEAQTLAAAGDEPAEPLFRKAAGYYEQMLLTFPEHERKAELSYLMAEAWHAAGELKEAITQYEKVAYDWLDPELGGKAGYAALVTLDQLMAQAENPADKAQWQAHKIDSAVQFADFYPYDERAPQVLANAADTLFQQNDPRAQVLAQRLTLWEPAPAVDIRKSAWLILAHTQFDDGDYAAAETAYGNVLALTAADDPQRDALIERVAASVFRQGEQLAEEGATAASVEQFLRIEQIAPGSDIAIRGQYDAGNYLMDLGQWQRAANVFQDFQTRHSGHELAGTIAPKMVVIHQELGQWAAAAAALTTMAATQTDPESKRQSLYMAAELYQKSGDLDQAAQSYERYVEAFPQPFDLATEARYQLVQLAETRGDRGARNQWLAALIAADAKAGDARTERSRYLAAYASNEFARTEFDQFERIKLTLPIKKSLQDKKQALDDTLKAYKKVLDYGVAEFVTEANYRIGTVYAQLSRDLLDSERPEGLDPLASEQYEILLEEQAWPFEEKSVELLESNAQRAWDGLYDQWVKRSFTELAKILPARYGKEEAKVEVSYGLH